MSDCESVFGQKEMSLSDVISDSENKDERHEVENSKQQATLHDQMAQ